MHNKNILISGAGIAGPTLAYWLHQYSFTPTVVETAPAPRKGGYLIDFWGVGLEVAEKMGLMPKLIARSYTPGKMVYLTHEGKHSGSLNLNTVRRALGGRVVTLLRSSLANIIYAKTRDTIEYIYDDTITDLTSNSDGVTVSFNKSPPAYLI